METTRTCAGGCGLGAAPGDVMCEGCRSAFDNGSDPSEWARIDEPTCRECFGPIHRSNAGRWLHSEDQWLAPHPHEAVGPTEGGPRCICGRSWGRVTVCECGRIRP